MSERPTLAEQSASVRSYTDKLDEMRAQLRVARKAGEWDGMSIAAALDYFDKLKKYSFGLLVEIGFEAAYMEAESAFFRDKRVLN